MTALEPLILPFSPRVRPYSFRDQYSMSHLVEHFLRKYLRILQFFQEIALLDLLSGKATQPLCRALLRLLRMVREKRRP